MGCMIVRLPARGRGRVSAVIVRDGHDDGGPTALPAPSAPPKIDGETQGVGAELGGRVHGTVTTSYPASLTAATTAASSIGPSPSTVSRPVVRSTSTPVTPGTSVTSSVTELTQ